MSVRQSGYALGIFLIVISAITVYGDVKIVRKLPDTSVNQAKIGRKLTRKDLKPGDLIFFDTSKERKGIVNHVGIYIGNNKFIHASSGAGKVVISSLDRPFYSQRFLWGQKVRGKQK